MSMNKTIHCLCRALSGAIALILIGCDSDGSSNQISESELTLGAATSADYIAIRVEAENYSNLTGGWTLTNESNIPTITPDPDPPHFSTASGSTYVELLPDTRVTHDDVFLPGENFWGGPGNGPRLEYNVTIPEPGRYYVFAKAYSTGLEDNGIHVGVNDQKPESGHRLQLCSGKHRWTWSSAQRVDTNHCGVTKTIFLDIDTAGSQKIVFYAREDGFELDQFVLLKDLNEEIRSCFPLVNDKIRCKDTVSGQTVGDYDLPVTVTTDGNHVVINPPITAMVDLNLSLAVDNATLIVGDHTQFTINVQNIDDTDTATNVKATISLPDNLSFISGDNCTVSGSQITCSFSEISPGTTSSASFNASPITSGAFRVDAQVTAAEQETALDNNTASVELDANEYIPAYDGALEIIQGSNGTGTNDQTTQLVIVKNVGLEPLSNITLRVLGNTTTTVTSPYEGCTTNTYFECPITQIQAGEMTTVPLVVTGISTGLNNIQIQLNVDADEDTTNNNLDIPIYVTDNNIITDNNGAIYIEAENFESQLNAVEFPQLGSYYSTWFLNSDVLSPTVQPDNDNTGAETASNNSYIELLPDTRVGGDDPVIENISNYSFGGDSSTLLYSVLFSEPGRYYIAARLRSNNDQDASVHIGINEEWPESARLVSVCAPNGEWQWTNSLQCNLQDSVAYIDISTAGLHSVTLSAATDGVEVDKMSLHLNSPELPTGFGGSSETYDAQNVDLEISSGFESAIYTVDIKNLDSTSAALHIKVELTGLTDIAADSINGFDGCVNKGEIIECDIKSISAGSIRSASIQASDTATVINAELLSAYDTDPTNNKSSASTALPKSGGGPLDLKLLLVLLAFSYMQLSMIRKKRTSLKIQKKVPSL